MIERFIGQIPFWARRDHPFVRYELRPRNAKMSVQGRYLRALLTLVSLALLLLGSYLIVTGFFSYPAGLHPTEIIHSVLSSPLILLQLLLQIGAFLITSATIGTYSQAGNWDSLRVTSEGASLAFRARWASVFYRLRGLFGMVVFLRVVLIAVMLYNLTSFQGRHLDLFIVGITPEVPLIGAVILLAFTMTAALLLPFTSAGLDGAFGALLSTFLKQKLYLTLAQILYVILRVGLSVVLMWWAEEIFSVNVYYGDLLNWGGMLISAAGGDLGLSLLYLARSGEIWATIPFGIFLGFALLIVALLQAALADFILQLAAGRAQGRE